jgi:hypothetical protein
MADKPTFDLGNLSWKDSKALSTQQIRLARAQEERDAVGLEAGFAGMERFLARAVVSVPRDWLVTDAPDALDWSDPASFDWLKSARMKDLMKALAEAQSPAEVSGN